MLIQLLLGIPLSVLNALASFLPKVFVLPFGIDSVLVQGMGYVHFLAGLIPPIGLMLDAFLFVIGFKLSLKLFAMIPILRGMLHK